MAFDPSTAQEFKVEIPKGILRFGGRSGSEERFRMLSPQVQEQLIGAAQDYHSQTGRALQINSAYRTIEDQQRLYDESVAAGRPGRGPTGMPIAKPGQSKHNKGIVVDIQQGKDDPLAQQILSQRGFAQNVAGDPVHFEFVKTKTPTPQQATPAPATPTIRFDPTSAKEFVEPVQPKAAPEGPGPLRTAQAGLAGITQGALAGLGQYPAAGMLSLASLAVPQGAPLSFSQALQQVRESQQGLREEAPLAYGAGEVGGSLAGFGKLAGLSKGATNVIPKATTRYQPIPLVASPARVAARETGEKIGSAIRGSMEPGTLIRGTGVAAGMGATQEYTRSPEATLGEAATTGGIAGGATLALGGVGKLAEWGIAKVGEKTLKSSVNDLIKNKDELNRVFGPAYEEVKTIALSQKPTMESVRAQILREAPDLAKKNPRTGNIDVDSKLVLKELNKQTAKWKADNEGISNIRTFAQRYAENPSLLQKYTARTPTTKFGEEVSGAAKELKRLESSSFGRQVVGQGIMGLAGSSGLGAAAGGLYGYLTEKDPLLYALGGGGAAPAALAAARLGGTTQYLNPMTFPSVGGMAAGSQSYRLGDLFRGERK